MYELLFNNFEKNGLDLDTAERELIQSFFKHRKYRKNQYVVQQGDVSKYETFVNKGMLRTYLVDDIGQEHTMKFSPEDWWAGDLYSFTTGNPSSYNVQCLEDTEVLQISQPDMELLFARVPKMNLYFRILYRNSVIAYNRRVAATLCNTALERYLEFLNKYPHIQQRVPNHLIASYLGIAPQSLSRIRKQVLVKS
ncbi:Crp/Fnr family transcriptional regulator [Desertivirga brevis]|uniref:Crp/Fnr family transcriptional regulator n=1 Tax=Desertivirga brevis TaxID=2810310 RepID=UPI001A957F93|nr:Crp/Fnr family transcriptional regulator [Pedobacter sp. SYSU D00873]